MSRVSRYSIPNTYEKEFTHVEDDWRGWEDITQEEIDIAESNGIDKYLLYQRVEVTFMPISKAITKPKGVNKGSVITKEQSKYLQEQRISHADIYRLMKNQRRTFEEAVEYYKYRQKYKYHKELALQNGVKLQRFYKRIKEGWTLEEASNKEGRREPIISKEQRKYIEENGVKVSSVYNCIKKGMTVEEAVEHYTSTSRERYFFKKLKEHNLTQKEYAILKRMGLSNKQIFDKYKRGVAE